MKAKWMSGMVLAAVAGVLAGSMAMAEPAADGKAAAGGQALAAQLPPGMTEADVQAMMAARTPGKMHEFLQRSVGTWVGTSKMWMGSGGEPMVSPAEWRITSLMDGRYVRLDTAGEMAGMGHFIGQGTTGFDNVSGRFVGTWVDNQITGIMFGTGELSPDGRTIHWRYELHCPMTGKPTVLRQVESFPDSSTIILDMFGSHPKTGDEFHMLRFEMKRKS